MMVTGMKKVAAALSGLGFLATAVTVFAQTGIPIQINPSRQGVDPFTTLGNLLSNILTIVFVLAAIIVLFMLIIGAFQWITSGGDKEGVGKARDRITHALIGLAILALAFLIMQVVGQIVGISILDMKALPTLGQKCPVNQVFDPTTASCQPAPRQ